MASGEYYCCDLAHFTDGSPTDDRQKQAIGQRVIISFSGPLPIAAAQVLIRDFCVGGVLLNASNFTDATQASQLVSRLASYSGGPHPFLVGIEQENGVLSGAPYLVRTTSCSQGWYEALVSTARPISHFPSQLTLGAGHSPSSTSAVSKAIGEELAYIGIHWILAPTIDFITELTEPLDTPRKFSDDPETVSQHARAYLDGLITTNVAASTEASLATTIQDIYRSLDRETTDIAELLERCEIHPIKRLLERRALECLHLTSSLTDYDDANSAQRAFQTVIQRLLREGLGCQAPITVASTSHLSTDVESCAKHAPLRTLLSGSDVVLLSSDPTTQEESIRAIYAAARTSTFPASVLNSAADRISSFRSEFVERLARRQQITEPSTFALQHQNLIRNAYRASTTTLSTGLSPLLNLPATSILLLLTPSVPPVARPNVAPNADPFEPLGRAIAHFHNRTRHVPYTLSAGVTSTHAAFLDRATAVVLVLCNTSSAFVESQMEFVAAVQDRIRVRESRPGEQKTRKVALAAGDPRDLREPLDGWWEVCCYEYTVGALIAATEVITGHRTATGILPIRLGRHLNGG